MENRSESPGVAADRRCWVGIRYDDGSRGLQKEGNCRRRTVEKILFEIEPWNRRTRRKKHRKRLILLEDRGARNWWHPGNSIVQKALPDLLCVNVKMIAYCCYFGINIMAGHTVASCDTDGDGADG